MLKQISIVGSSARKDQKKLDIKLDERVCISRKGEVGGERWDYYVGIVSGHGPKVLVGRVSVERNKQGYTIKEEYLGRDSPLVIGESILNEGVSEIMYAEEVLRLDSKAYCEARKIAETQNLNRDKIEGVGLNEGASLDSILSLRKKEKN